jgi:ATP-dependent RNA helicase DDX52/ROK1
VKTAALATKSKSNDSGIARRDPLDFFGTAPVKVAAKPAAAKGAKSAAGNKPGNKPAKGAAKKRGRASRANAADESESANDSDGDSGDDSDDAASFSAASSSRSHSAEPVLLRGSARKVKRGRESRRADAEAAARQVRLEHVQHLRKAHGIHIDGTDVAEPLESFGELTPRLRAREYLVRNVAASGYTAPTPIQMQAVPVMASGRDLLAGAPTGTGKTASFVLPILLRLRQPEKGAFRALVLTPTHELAQQTHREFLKLGDGKKWRVTVLTKATASRNSFGPDAAQRTDVLITTPQRLVQMIRDAAVVLDRVHMLVFDEADRLWEMGGFLEQVDEILAACKHPEIQRCLFSATLPQPIEELARTVLRDPVRVLIGERNAAALTVKQRLVFVGQEEGKLIAVRQLIQRGFRAPAMIFVQSIERAKELFHELVYDGVRADVIHGERTQAQRDAVVENLRSGKVWVLICTELMARGVDFRGVNLVINYDFPQSVVSYVHRIGRTGRMTREGEAVTFFTEADMTLLKSVANVLRASGCEVPDWMLEIKVASKSKRRRLMQRAPLRRKITTVPKVDRDKAAKKRDYKRNNAKKRRLAEDAEAAGPGDEGGAGGGDE